MTSTPPSSTTSKFSLNSAPWVGITFPSSASSLLFTIHDPTNPTTSTLTLSREQSEPVSASLTRLLLNVKKKWLKKQLASQLPATSTVTLSSTTLLSSSPIPLPLPPKIINTPDFWKEAASAGIVFNIPTPTFSSSTTTSASTPAPTPPTMTKQFHIVLSPPLLPSPALSPYLSGKYDLYPGTPVTVAKTDEFPQDVELSYSWSSSSKPSLPSTSSHYTPTVEDVGSRIRCCITPHNDTTVGLPTSITFSNPVLPVPSTNPLFALRSPFLSTPLSSDTVRVVTYNILADLYTSQKSQHKTLWSYTDPKFLHSSFRMPLILCELIHHDPTLIFLQEVDTTSYKDLFAPVLSALGYDGAFGEKCGNQREGVATFWKREEFEFVEKECVPVRDLTTVPPSSPEWNIPSLNDFISAHSNLHEIMATKVGTVCLFATLRSLKNGRHAVLTNTHLFYHPLADHIRLLQTYFILHRASQLASSTNAGFIIAGDFNSDPPSGACQLMCTRTVEPSTPTHDDCFSNLHRLVWGARGVLPPVPSSSSIDPNLPSPPSVSLPPSFPPLFNATGYPPFTNYAVGFIAQLDYVFPSSSHFELVRTAPSLQKEQVEPHTAMPNELMPSDHVLLCCEIKWKV